MAMLNDLYPRLYLYVLKSLNRNKKYDEFKSKCLKWREENTFDSKKYSYYVHCYLMPWFETERREGRLKDVRINRQLEDGNYIKYDGEIDTQGKACGFGILTD